MKLQSYISIALLCFCTGVSASGYVGFGIGKTDYDADDISTFDDPVGIDIYLGYEFSENLALEFGFISFGEADDGIPPEWHLEADSFAFSLLGKAPVGEKSEVFFQLGFHSWDVELSEDGFGVFAEDDGIDKFWGVGFRANVSDKVELGLRLNRYDFDNSFEADVTRFSINAQMGFE